MKCRIASISWTDSPMTVQLSTSSLPGLQMRRSGKVFLSPTWNARCFISQKPLGLCRTLGMQAMSSIGNMTRMSMNRRSQLIKKAIGRARQQATGDYSEWIEAIRLLAKEDRYLLVMVERAHLGSAFRVVNPKLNLSVWRPLIAGGTLFLALVLLLGWRFPTQTHR